MKTMMLIATLIVALAASSAHAQKRLGSSISGDKGNVFVNAEYSPKKFNKILVVTPLMDEKFNSKIMDALKDIQAPMVNWISVLPPVKEYTEDDKKAIYAKHAIDGVIDIKILQSETQSYLYATGTTVTFETDFIDLSTNTNAAKFTGQTTLGTLSTNKEKAVVQWAKLISPEIEVLVKK